MTLGILRVPEVLERDLVTRLLNTTRLENAVVVDTRSYFLLISLFHLISRQQIRLLIVEPHSYTEYSLSP